MARWSIFAGYCYDGQTEINDSVCQMRRQPTSELLEVDVWQIEVQKRG